MLSKKWNLDLKINLIIQCLVKKHTSFALSKISKAGTLKPMFGITHSIDAKLKMSIAKSKSPIGLYDIDNNLIKPFINQVELANYLSVNKSTISPSPRERAGEEYR